MSRFRALLPLALTAVAVACGGAAETDGGHPLRAVVVPYLSMAPMHIAAAEGFFADEQLDVEFVTLQRHQEVMTALVRGDVDVVAGMLSVNELNLAARGERVRIVAGLGQLTSDHCSFSSFLTRTEHAEAGRLDDPDEIRKLVFDADLLIPFGYWLDEFLAPHGLTVDDLELVNLPSTASTPALLDGTIDVTIESEPFLSQLEADPGIHVWERTDEVVPDFFVSVVMYGPNLLDDRREDGVRFLRAFLRALRQYDEGKTPRNREIVEGFSGLPPERVEAACWADARRDGRVDPEGFRGYQEWNVARGYVDRVLDDDELFDLTFVERANADLDGS